MIPEGSLLKLKVFFPPRGFFWEPRAGLNADLIREGRGRWLRTTQLPNACRGDYLLPTLLGIGIGKHVHYLARRQ